MIEFGFQVDQLEELYAIFLFQSRCSPWCFCILIVFRPTTPKNPPKKKTKKKKTKELENPHPYNEQKQKKKLLCIIRESNTGLVDGNDEFYH